MTYRYVDVSQLNINISVQCTPLRVEWVFISKVSLSCLVTAAGVCLASHLLPTQKTKFYSLGSFSAPDSGVSVCWAALHLCKLAYVIVD